MKRLCKMWYKIGVDINITLEIAKKLIKDFYGIDIPITSFHDPKIKDRIYDENIIFKGKPLTIRSVLQSIGNNGRNEIFKTCWIEALNKQNIEENNINEYKK